jgi:hypothetical protein
MTYPDFGDFGICGTILLVTNDPAICHSESRCAVRHSQSGSGRECRLFDQQSDHSRHHHDKWTGIFAGRAEAPWLVAGRPLGNPPELTPDCHTVRGPAL